MNDTSYQLEMHLMAARGKWLIDHLTECTVPDGRTVLELVETPIWVKPNGTLDDYIAAVDQAMDADESHIPTGEATDSDFGAFAAAARGKP